MVGLHTPTRSDSTLKSSVLSTNITYLPFDLLYNQVRISYRISTLGSSYPESRIASTISRYPYSVLALLLAWTQNIYISDKLFRIW